MKIGIIGAGAAGLMAAATIQETDPSLEILLFERNSKIGRKIAISGGSRCNVTTGVTNKKELLTKYPRGAEFLKKHPFKIFPPQKVMDWFEAKGLPLKVESDMRVFPISDDGEAVNDIFFPILEKSLYLSEAVLSISIVDQNKFEITTSKNTYIVDKLIITTGGNAYAHTGSTGDGYNFARSLGHTITELGPSLNSFIVDDPLITNLSGLSLDSAQLSYKNIQIEGPILFTHFGVSGPATFAFASHLPYETITPETPLIFKIKFNFTKSDLDTYITKHGKQNILTVIKHWLPERLAQTLLTQNQINPTQRSAEISGTQRQDLTSGLSVKTTRRRPGDEFVTAGGIDLTEINPKTMQSFLNPNLYFAGEILDIDGYTGGFNLQSAWATGRVAGLHITQSK